jgi:hypothetical protein
MFGQTDGRTDEGTYVCTDGYIAVCTVLSKLLSAFGIFLIINMVYYKFVTIQNPDRIHNVSKYIRGSKFPVPYKTVMALYHCFEGF